MSDSEKVTIERLFRLDGDTALVTGGGGGLGRIAALARRSGRWLPRPARGHRRLIATILWLAMLLALRY